MAELIFWKARLTYGAMVLPDAGLAAKARKRDGEVSPCSLLCSMLQGSPL
jgi:hypothetical protein